MSMMLTPISSYELMAEPQRDNTPEQAAARLRHCGGELYRNKLDKGDIKEEEFGNETPVSKPS